MSTASERGRSNRAKGARFERQIAKELEALLGAKFSRNLTQYQQQGQGDLTCEDEGFPFSIECKAQETLKLTNWWGQAVDEAARAGLRPALIYKLNRQQIRVRVTMDDALNCMVGHNAGGSDHFLETDLNGFAYLAREGWQKN